VFKCKTYFEFYGVLYSKIRKSTSHLNTQLFYVDPHFQDTTSIIIASRI